MESLTHTKRVEVYLVQFWGHNSMSQIFSPFYADYQLLVKTYSVHKIHLRHSSFLWSQVIQQFIWRKLKLIGFPIHNFRRNIVFLISLWTLTLLVLQGLMLCSVTRGVSGYSKSTASRYFDTPPPEHVVWNHSFKITFKTIS